MNRWASFINSENIKIRFLSTLFVNISRIGLSVLAGIIVARGLEPKGFGDFNFLLVSFSSIMSLLDMGTASAFYTFLSQRKRSGRFYFYYALWLAIQFLLVLMLIILIFPDSLLNKIWLGHTRGIILLAFFASFMMNKIWPTITEAGESIRATVIVQLHNIALPCLYLGAILAMVLLRSLSLWNLFIVVTVVHLLLALVLAKRLKSRLIDFDKNKEERFQNIAEEFRTYCSPLIIFGVVSFAYLWADVWFLQKFGGAVQQGFYSVGLRFSAICLIATTSMLKVFWKEIAEAYERGNSERLHHLYARISRSLCFVAAMGACLLVPFSKEIIVLLLGPKYEAGWLCLGIMFLYPIHQSLGQINGSYLYATGQTKLYSRIGITMMMVSIPVSYLVLASPSSRLPGLGLGSVGLALKMVILNIVSVNILGFFISRLSKWKFKYLYQFETVALLLLASFVSKGVLSWIGGVLEISIPPLLLILLCVPIYILGVVVIVFLFPGLSGLDRKEITGLTQRLNGYFARART
ncbi:MAG: lipopolysaccharide biosynthesis protein [Candidatus Thorarchaeota archaeon]|jgi:O-antigen/teichoic acid export membrane protein